MTETVVPGAIDEALTAAASEALSLRLRQTLEDVLTEARYGRPGAENEAQALLSADIDAIVKRLDEGIPRLDARLDHLLERQRRPRTV